MEKHLKCVWETGLDLDFPGGLRGEFAIDIVHTSTR
jgi:hypothetical protein